MKRLMTNRGSYEELERENAELRQRVEDLERELGEVKSLLKRFLEQDSHNSHKPPSEDKKRYPKTKLKVRGVEKKERREKETLGFREEPDYQLEVNLEVAVCGCGQDLAELASCWELVQVYDLPKLKLEVTAYKRERKRCRCGEVFEASLPEGVNRGVQYGGRVKGLLSYLHQYQLLPLKRCVELMGDVFGEAMCEKSLLNAEQGLYEALEGCEESILEGLRVAKHVHSDETGVFVEQNNHWLHVCSNEHLTYYHLNRSRGLKAHEAIGILGHCAGHMVHDCFHSYFKHQGSHVLCHSHTLRELLAVWEETAQDWALALAHHLLDAQHERQSQALSLERQTEHVKIYQDLLAQGLRLNPETLRPPANRHRGKVKQSKAHNLVQRLLRYQDAALSFIRDPSLPFTNNQAERDLRMVKVKQKISGGFRTYHGARIFCRIRGYISTLRKQGINILDALTSAFQLKLVFPRF